MAYLKNTDAQSPMGLKLGENFVIGNSHDGSTAFFMGITTQIYRCSNMFTQRNMQAKVYHRSDQEQRVREAVKTIDLYYDQQRNLYTQWEDLGSKNALPNDPATVVNGILGIETQEQINGLSTRKQNIREKMFASISREVKALGNNIFGIFNGITHYTSNVMTQKNALYGNPFGRAAELNKKAFELCQGLAKERKRKTIIHLPAPSTKTDYFS